jgi:hypothetical protein
LSCSSGNCHDGKETCKADGLSCVECNTMNDCAGTPNYNTCNTSNVCQATMYCPGTDGKYLVTTPDVCWYRGDAVNQSCDKVCVNKAQSTTNLDRTKNYVGSEAANKTNCETVADLVDNLGSDTSADLTTTTYGVGCYISSGSGYPWKWEDTGPTTSTGVKSDAYRVCGCNLLTCTGQIVGGYCWYKGTAGQSCETVCASNGHYGVATAAYAGSGGTDVNCQAVAAKFGTYAWGGTVTRDAGGLGCHTNGTTLYRDTNLTNNVASNGSYQRFCACFGGGGSPDCDHGGGVSMGGYCWFAGGDNADCSTTTCPAHGGTYNAATQSYAGYDGSEDTTEKNTKNAQCDNVMTALGAISTTVSNGSCPSGGVGCGWYDTTTDTRLRCTNTATTNTGKGDNYYRVCACNMPQCEQDLNCDTGKYCNTAAGTCDTCNVEAHCGADCSLNCATTACTSGHCDDGFKECKDGTSCVDCVSNSDCASGYVCESNVCTVYCPGTGGKYLAATPDVCWYLGTAGQSCDTTCASTASSTYSGTTLDYAGTGGNNTQCANVLALFSKSGTVTNPADGCADSTGKIVAGLPEVCWRLGASSASCTTTCGSYGG